MHFLVVHVASFIFLGLKPLGQILLHASHFIECSFELLVLLADNLQLFLFSTIFAIEFLEDRSHLSKLLREDFLCIFNSGGPCSDVGRRGRIGCRPGGFPLVCN